MGVYRARVVFDVAADATDVTADVGWTSNFYVTGSTPGEALSKATLVKTALRGCMNNQYEVVLVGVSDVNTWGDFYANVYDPPQVGDLTNRPAIATTAVVMECRTSGPFTGYTRFFIHGLDSSIVSVDGILTTVQLDAFKTVCLANCVLYREAATPGGHFPAVPDGQALASCEVRGVATRRLGRPFNGTLLRQHRRVNAA